MGTKKPSEIKKIRPDFFEKRPKDVNWVLKVVDSLGITQQFIGCDWEATSRFGTVSNKVVVDQNGQPLFDRPEYREAENVNVVVWGKDPQTGEIKIGVISEVRPHADNPLDPLDDHTAVIFGQIPMGFLDKIIGKGYEDIAVGGARETMEETGASVVKGVSRPAYPYQNMSPSFLATWNNLIFIEVDLEKVKDLSHTEAGELIIKAEYIPVKELLRRIKEGTQKGVIYRSGNSLSALMIFFATFPEYFI